MFNLLHANESNNGYTYLKNVFNSFAHSKIIVCSAGGDGTFVGVLSRMAHLNIPLEHNRIEFSVFPFGTGNDLSQALNWGRVVPVKDTNYFERFCKHIMYRVDGVRDTMDMWSVTMVANEHGFIRQAPSHENKKTITRMMASYMSLGLQGVIGYDFEKNRHKSRLLNIMEYMRQCLRVGICAPMERVPEFLASIECDGNVYKLSDTVSEKTVEVMIQNCCGIWGRQINLWDTCKKSKKSRLYPEYGPTDAQKWTKTTLNDGKLDVFSISSRLDYAVKQIHSLSKASELKRFGQFPEIKIKPYKEKRFHAMIDGEFFDMFDIDYILIERVCKINVVKGV